MVIESCHLSPLLKGANSHGTEGGPRPVGALYRRMFHSLPVHPFDEELLLAIGRAGSTMDCTDQRDSTTIPAGFAFVGQFIAHDITYDQSLLQPHNDLETVRNHRSPRFDLESIYGLGPTPAPYMFDNDDPDKFLIALNDAGKPCDFPRNQQGRAISADPRDDTHTIISQLHVAFLKFHNRIVDWLREQGATGSVFEQARDLARWHFQWIVVNEFLALHIGPESVVDIARNGRKHYACDEETFIPFEFADAVYRFGHAQIRETYRLNAHSEPVPIFPDLLGRRPVPDARCVDWRLFFAYPNQPAPQMCKRLDPTFCHTLMALPEPIVGETQRVEHTSLAARDLVRGSLCELPSAEQIAREMGFEPLTREQVGLAQHGWDGDTPLFYYILREAELLHNGEQLGPVGGRILGEVLIGLLQEDPNAYFNVNPTWTPTLPANRPGHFTMADLLSFAEGA